MKPTPFQIFCGYYLGLDRDFNYRFLNQRQLAAHYGLDSEEMRHLIEECHLTPEISRHVDYNLVKAHATAQELFDAGRRDDVIDHARRTFEEFRQALVRYDPSKDFENIDYDRLFPGDAPAKPDNVGNE
jgi:hypothetical protein